MEQRLNLPAGFTKAVYKFKPRIIVGVESVQRKSGKTHFSMTAPADVAYCSFDKQSREDVLAKFPHKNVYDKSYCMGDMKDAKEIIAAFEKDFEELVKSSVRTIVIDTGSDLYGLLQLALWGKQTQIPPFRYYEVNQWFSNKVVNPIINSDKNLIVNYIMGKVYVKVGEKDAWNGDYERKGFRDSDGLSQLNIRLERDERTMLFKAVIVNSSQNAAAAGLEFTSNPYEPEPSFDDLTGDPDIDNILFENHKCSFPWVAQAIFPHTQITDWL